MTTTRPDAPPADARPAYIADATPGDTITYMVQRLDTTGPDPVVIDSYVTTTYNNPSRFNNGFSSAIAWNDSDGVTHRNAVNFHVWIHVAPETTPAPVANDSTPVRDRAAIVADIRWCEKTLRTTDDAAYRRNIRGALSRYTTELAMFAD